MSKAQIKELARTRRLTQDILPQRPGNEFYPGPECVPGTKVLPE